MLQFGDPLVLRVSSIQMVGGRWAWIACRPHDLRVVPWELGVGTGIQAPGDRATAISQAGGDQGVSERMCARVSGCV